jgi:dsRNA-specific ribonuclease
MRLRQWLLFLLLVIPGVFCFLFCMNYALQDWVALQAAYDNFARVANTSNDMSTLFVAEANQSIHRINLFADVVWALLGAIVAAIGIHGLCVNTARQR